MITQNQPIRMTKQRRIILEELRKVDSHPTADEVYKMARRRMPHISLGTVYRNLELLSSCNLIQKLELAGTQKRFDGNPAAHHHIRCIHCGRVCDLCLDLDLMEAIPSLETDFEVLSHRLEFFGICPECGVSE